jgi:bifunctional non-homologous end joining protein LigD
MLVLQGRSNIAGVTTRLAFITPAKPTLRNSPPRGERWLHEFKFDGWRLQVAKAGRAVRLYTSGGHDIAKRLPGLARAFDRLPGSAVIDAELFALDGDTPSFKALHSAMADGRDCDLSVYAFDLLSLNGRDLRPLPLIERKRRLEDLVDRAGIACWTFAQHFDDGARTLAVACANSLEGIVSKRRDQPYRAGACDWVKVKNPDWVAANRERWRMFRRSVR